MDYLNFRQQFLSNVHTRKMVNIEYTPDFLIPNNYHYEKELLSPLSPESFLYLLGGGSIHTDSPLTFRFSSMDCHLLLLTTMGSGRITTPGGSETSADDGHVICFDCSQNFSLQSVVLPWNFKLFFISGGSSVCIFFCPWKKRPEFSSHPDFSHSPLYPVSSVRP